MSLLTTDIGTSIGGEPSTIASGAVFALLTRWRVGPLPEGEERMGLIRHETVMSTLL